MLDSYRKRKTAMVPDWLAMYPRFHLHFRSTSASWIHRVERQLADLTERRVCRGTHRRTQGLEAAIAEHLTVHNENPNPFAWRNSADRILESRKSLRQRICETGHYQLAQGRRGPPFNEGTEIRGRDH